MPFSPSQRFSEPDNPHYLLLLLFLNQQSAMGCTTATVVLVPTGSWRTQTMDQNEQREGGWGLRLRKKEFMQMRPFSGNSSVLPVRQILPPSAGVRSSTKAFSVLMHLYLSRSNLKSGIALAFQYLTLQPQLIMFFRWTFRYVILWIKSRQCT